MCTDATSEALRQALRARLLALEVGDWRSVLYPDLSRVKGEVSAGPGEFVRLGAVLEIVADSMRWQACGDVNHAWELLGQAAGRLPTTMVQRSQHGSAPRASLVPQPQDETSEAGLKSLTARIIWREQRELDDLHSRLAPGRLTPREQLIEACVEQMYWIEFDPFTWDRRVKGSPLAKGDGTSVDRSRKALCARATRLRQFGEPTRGDLSQSVYYDVGFLRGLWAEGLRRLADQPVPAPWYGINGAENVVVRFGRVRAWQYARGWAADLNYWKRAS